MLTASEIRRRLKLSRAQFEHLLEDAGDRAPKPIRLGTVRAWREDDFKTFELVVAEAERCGGLRR